MRYELGLVLSGGGVRGLAHVGVLKALGEAGVSPEVVAGTSSGAIVAAFYAGGYSPSEVLEFFVTKNPFRFSKLALAKPGIFDTAKVAADLLEYFPENSFEALAKPIFLTATDLVEARLEVFSAGRLIPAILASASTPLVFTPTLIDGHWYSDGGIIDNFPTEPLIGHCRCILGVYGSPLRAIDFKDLSTSLAVSQRSLEIGMYYSSQRKFHQCDVLIQPRELNKYGTFDTKYFADIMEIGYQAALAQMDAIVRLTKNHF